MFREYRLLLLLYSLAIRDIHNTITSIIQRDDIHDKSTYMTTPLCTYICIHQQHSSDSCILVDVDVDTDVCITDMFKTCESS